MSLERVSAVCVIVGVLIAAVALFIQYEDHKRANTPPQSPPRTAEELFFDGSELKNRGRYREAIEVFTEASNQVHTDTAAGQYQAALIEFSLGECYLRTGDCRQASRYLGLLTADRAGLFDVLKAEFDHAPCQ